MILSLKGCKIAITGELKMFVRSKAYSLIKAEGGVPKDKITMDTDLLVVTDSQSHCSGKILKAEKWGIEMICEDDFYYLLGY